MRALLLGMVLLAGCLLPTPPAAPRYYAPDVPAPRDAYGPVRVRLGVVRSPIYLRESITWRRSEVEYGFYEQRRWTELPSTYVERALHRELFPAGGPVPVAADVPVLTADVRAFDEVLAPVHEGRVAIAVTVADSRCIWLRRTFEATRPLSSDDPDALARAIGESLDAVARSTGDAVRKALSGRCGR
jgi:ABC-type uncharacterized transport system auxiliary subunit